MRIRIMELPMEHVGEVTSTPFVLVLDRCDGTVTQLSGEALERMKSATGARGVLVFPDSVQIGDYDDLAERAA